MSFFSPIGNNIMAIEIAIMLKIAESARAPAPIVAESSTKIATMLLCLLDLLVNKLINKTHKVAAEVIAQELGFVEGIMKRASGTDDIIDPQSNGLLNLWGETKYVAVNKPTNKRELKIRIMSTLKATLDPTNILIIQ